MLSLNFFCMHWTFQVNSSKVTGFFECPDFFYRRSFLAIWAIFFSYSHVFTFFLGWLLKSSKKTHLNCYTCYNVRSFVAYTYICIYSTLGIPGGTRKICLLMFSLQFSILWSSKWCRCTCFVRPSVCPSVCLSVQLWPAIDKFQCGQLKLCCGSSSKVLN